MNSVFVHPRIQERHPDICEDDVRDAWRSCICSVPRIDKDPNEYIAVGVDRNGRLIELVALRSEDGDWLIFHAKTPPTKKTLIETGLAER